MKVLSIFILSFLLFSCLKENLDRNDLDRVIIFQVDAETYKFEGGKEFSYFEGDTSTVNLPVSVDYLSSSPTNDGSLTVRYLSDTLFDGTILYGGFSGKRKYPSEMDDANRYQLLDNPITQPEDAKFQTIFYDLGTEPIYYDSIWGAIRNLATVNSYLNSNPKAKIGLFLYRPSEGVVSNPGNWKWYVMMKN